MGGGFLACLAKNWFVTNYDPPLIFFGGFNFLER
jgi:hypothetical protein